MASQYWINLSALPYSILWIYRGTVSVRPECLLRRLLNCMFCQSINCWPFGANTSYCTWRRLITFETVTEPHLGHFDFVSPCSSLHAFIMTWQFKHSTLTGLHPYLLSIEYYPPFPSIQPLVSSNFICEVGNSITKVRPLVSPKIFSASGQYAVSITY